LLLISPAFTDRADLNMESQQKNDQDATSNRTHVPAEASQSIDWYAEGEERVVEADGIQISVRFVGRKGRRGRIAITAPPGAAFRTHD
jgi:hypothetical protein